jgi:hypothetical protein
MYLAVFLEWLVFFCVMVCTVRQPHSQTTSILRYCAWVQVLIFYHYLRWIWLCFSCCLHSHTLELRLWRVRRWFVLAPHTHIHTQTHKCACLFVFLSIPDMWLPNSDSLSLLTQSYIPTRILVCVCMYIFVPFLFVFLSIPYSWLPNSLFFLDTGSFICPATSCRPWHPAFLPVFHHLSECLFFLCLFT